MAEIAEQTPDLFDGGSKTLEARRSFEQWADQRLKRGFTEQSLSVYRAMWGALQKWCEKGGHRTKAIDPLKITVGELEAFLNSLGGAKDPTLRYQWRMLQLVGKVLDYHALHQQVDKNQAAEELIRRSPALRSANSRIHDPEQRYLTSQEARALVSHLGRNSSGSGNWQSKRNHLAVALHLGAGVTPGEARELRVQDVCLSGGQRKLRVRANGTVQAHEAPVARWAARLLEDWLELRSKLVRERGDGVSYLLPSGGLGGPMSKTIHYEAVGAVLEEVGLPGKGGAYRLRHTFALRQLKRGASAADVAGWLGIEVGAVEDRYRCVITEPEEVW